jgi:hypothetical protein
MIKVNNKVHVTMGIIIEVHIEEDLIRIKAMKEEGADCLLSLTFFNSRSKLSNLLFRSSSVLQSSLISETAESG